MLEPLFLTACYSPVYPECCTGKLTQKGAVMADQNIARPGRLQLCFQPCDRLDVQVVRRLVEQHQIGGLGHQPRQRGAAPLAARCGLHRSAGVEFQTRARALHPVHLAGLQRGAGKIAQRGEPGHVRVLLHISHAHARRDHAVSAVRFNQARHHLEKGRFSRSIAPHQRNPIPRLHHQRQPVEHRIAPECERNVIELQKRCPGHGAALSPPPPEVKPPQPACALKSRLRASGIAWISTPVNTCIVFSCRSTTA